MDLKINTVMVVIIKCTLHTCRINYLLLLLDNKVMSPFLASSKGISMLLKTSLRSMQPSEAVELEAQLPLDCQSCQVSGDKTLITMG